MKQILIVLLTIIRLGAHAQSTAPRYGLPPYTYTDNSAATINFYCATYKDTAGSTIDTLQLSPRHNILNNNITVVDSCVTNLKSLKGCYYNDQMTYYVTCPTASAGVLVLNGNFVVATGTKRIALTQNKHFFIRFWFDGSNWVEETRNANY